MRRVFNWARAREWAQLPPLDAIMNTWLSLLAVLGAALLAAASPVTDGGVCDIDDHDLPYLHYITSLLQKMIKPCLTDAMTDKMFPDRSEAKDLVDYQNLYREFCPNVSQVTTCMAGVRESLAHCHNKTITLQLTSLIEPIEHLLTAGCENDGERLAYINHWVYLIKNRPDVGVPHMRCVYKIVAFIKFSNGVNFDLACQTYLLYKDAASFKECTKHVEDEAYKAAVQWMINEILTTMKCKHPEEERLIPCSEVDVSKLSVSNECHIKPPKKEEDYARLEDMAIIGCHWEMFSHDQLENSNHTDLDWLKEDYKAMCEAEREVPDCLLNMSAWGESILSQEEDKQFQLQLQALEEAVKRVCVEDGARLAEIMHHVYAMTPEHGHAFRVCLKSTYEASAPHEGHAVSTKTMRFYHDTAAFWQCVVGKMHENNDFVQTIEAMKHDILKMMKCVNPENGAVVSCESLHEHH